MVDDSAAIRKAALFPSHPHFEVVGEAEHGVRLSKKLPCFDLNSSSWTCQCPVLNGLEAAPSLLKILPFAQAEALAA